MMDIKKFEDPSGNVWKYVFHFDDAIAEAVLYRYGSFKERTVMCVSVQSGCPVGCVFCGTGRNFIRNFTYVEIIEQVNHLVCEVLLSYNPNSFDIQNCNKFQIMFMSMGEPMLNITEVCKAVNWLNISYPNAQLLLSTIGIKDIDSLDKILNVSINIPKVGLQFSIHDAFESDRNELIPFKNKLTLREIRDYGIIWNSNTNRPVYLNYCISDTSYSYDKFIRLMDLFPPSIFYFTFSVVCEKEEGKMSENDMDKLNRTQEIFIEQGYNVRIFDPAGKDTIGGGCGQLWYVQEYFKQYSK